ncbi:unnamed protein product [Cyclocybe aegerita]|uniref:G domain-containing protein n=1 Tax=Cyclocybe aegerita TaxID=1973307 RepID=A0A8S0VUS7_CYCAE|nr:unnamed protein product [Cyclocybe aegerita]
MSAAHGSVSLIGDTSHFGSPKTHPHVSVTVILCEMSNGILQASNPRTSFTMDRRSGKGRSSTTPFNVVLFGESGAGKSSILNMLLGTNVAAVSGGATGCTFESTGYDISIDGTSFRVHDTVGLEDGEHGRIPTSKAIVQLYSLLRRLEGGISLLIFCMRAPRVKESAKHNWILFYDIICQCRVPISIVVTGLEQERDMDGWWKGNEKTFRQYGMHSHGHACITAIRGKKKANGQYSLQQEYDESMLKVKNMIKTCYQEQPRPVERVHWFQRVVYETTYEHHCWGTEVIKTKVGDMKGAVDELVDRCGMPKKDAEALAKELNKIK